MITTMYGLGALFGTAFIAMRAEVPSRAADDFRQTPQTRRVLSPLPFKWTPRAILGYTHWGWATLALKPKNPGRRL